MLVLAGGPDGERPISLQSGSTITAALRQAGHDVIQRDITPDDLSALDEFNQWQGQVIFPILHGRWGEGGGLQRILEKRNLPYVGSRASAADLCMDKARTKQVLRRSNLPTPDFHLLDEHQALPGLGPPLVIKAVDEGSSLGLFICHDATEVDAAIHKLRQTYPRILVERFVPGMEITVGIVDGPGKAAAIALPPIQILPAAEYYDYQAKYDRDDTQYRFDIDLPRPIMDMLAEQALATHHALGARHLSRVDFIVDAEHRPWILEINTLPGFTSHSLLPMAARRAGLALPELVDRLVRLALDEVR